MLKSIIAAAGLFGFTLPGVARDDFAAGVAAYQRGDYATALRFWRPLAEQGQAVTQFNLGRMYATGRGVPQDLAEAARWHRKAAEQGVSQAQCDLGLLYQSGLGVSRDYVQAHKWFNLAAASYYASETEGRDFAVSNRNQIAAEMTPEQIAEAQALAAEWKPVPEGAN